VDVRIVAATNRNLRDCMQDGTFREDLYYRLNVVEVNVPPLRVRKSDIPLLAHAFLRRFAKENARENTGFAPEAMQNLLAYPWPGNVRELENAIERAVVLCETEQIGPEALPTYNRETNGNLHLVLPSVSLAELERLAILQTLEAVGGSTAKAAELLGTSRRKIQYRLKEWGLCEQAIDIASTSN
jgi:two-component system response regulator HydG